MFDTPVADAAASELIRQHAAREPFRALDGELRPDCAQTAYQVQDCYVRQLAQQRGTQICGYKIALTTPAMRDMVGYHDSIAGCLFADQLLSSGQSIRATAYGRLILEFEIAFRMARDLPERVHAWDRHNILEYVACAYPALEIADDRNADYATLAQSVFTLAADNAWNQGLVLGDSIDELDANRLQSVEGVAWLNGREVGRGTGKDVLGHPLEALAWLANHAETRGHPLRKDALVTTGSLVKSQFPSAGTQVRFELLGVGDVRLNVI